MHVSVRVSTISIICYILFELKTGIYRSEKVRKEDDDEMQVKTTVRDQ